MRFNSEEYDDTDLFNELDDDLDPRNFTEWMREQNMDAYVDHGCGWNKCAVGEWVNWVVDGRLPNDSDTYELLRENATDMERWSKAGLYELYQYLNHQGGDTYGEIVRFIDGDYNLDQLTFLEDLNEGDYDEDR